MSMGLLLQPETVFELRLTQEASGTLVMSTSGAPLTLHLVPVLLGAKGRDGEDGEDSTEPGPPGDPGDPGEPGEPGEPGAALIDDELAPSDEGADAATWSIVKTHAALKRVRFDAEQELEQEQQQQACRNIGIGNPATDLLSFYLVIFDGKTSARQQRH